jgi:hypothetical protein
MVGARSGWFNLVAVGRVDYGGGVLPKENVVRASDFLLLHGNGVNDPDRIAAMVRQTRQVVGYRPMPILFNEDDHQRRSLRRHQHGARPSLEPLERRELLTGQWIPLTQLAPTPPGHGVGQMLLLSDGTVMVTAPSWSRTEGPTARGTAGIA